MEIEGEPPAHDIVWTLNGKGAVRKLRLQNLTIENSNNVQCREKISIPLVDKNYKSGVNYTYYQGAATLLIRNLQFKTDQTFNLI